jgi:hypothetical protein
MIARLGKIKREVPERLRLWWRSVFRASVILSSAAVAHLLSTESAMTSAVRRATKI